MMVLMLLTFQRLSACLMVHWGLRLWVVHHYTSSPHTWWDLILGTQHPPWRRTLAHLTPSVLSLVRFPSDTNTTLIHRIPLFQKLLPPPHWVAIQRFPSSFFFFLRISRCVRVSFSLCSLCSQMCSWCFRFSGTARGGKHRLIKSTSGPWWMSVSVHCCLLIAVTQRGASSLIQFKVYAKRTQFTAVICCTTTPNLWCLRGEMFENVLGHQLMWILKPDVNSRAQVLVLWGFIWMIS